MRKLAAVVLFVAVALWSSFAFAQYSALGDVPDYGPWIGAGGIFISGDNNAAPADSDSEFLPTVNLTGLTEYLTWQVFYRFGEDSTMFGGNIDYVFASNFDECNMCPDEGMWWFGIGPSIIDVTDLYYDAANAAASLDDTLFGGNLMMGYAWEKWAFNFYVHYFSEEQLAVQGMVLYSLGSND